MTEYLLSSDAVTAVLYKLGRGGRFINDIALHLIFDDASRNSDDFSFFSVHPNYKISQTLSDDIVSCVLASDIERVHSLSDYFIVKSHPAGPYGEGILKKLSQKGQEVASEVAEKIRNIYPQE